jgi:hypothetical protein
MVNLAGSGRPEGGNIVGSMRKLSALVAFVALAVLTMTTVAVGVTGPAQAATGGSTPLSASSSAVATQNGHLLSGKVLPTDRAAAVAPRSITSSYGFLSIFQEASNPALNISVDGGPATSLTQGDFVYGLVPAGTHTITAKGGSIDVSGTVTIGAGENWTSLVYLNHGGVPVITGFLNNRAAPGTGNSRIVMRNTAEYDPVDIYINGTLSAAGTDLVNEASNPPASGSISVPAGEVTIAVVPHGQPNTAPNTIASASGDLVSGDLLNIFLVSDTTTATGFSLLTNANPLGAGYRLYAADGGTFNYGSALFNGSLGGSPINKPVVGATPTQIGLGYWMVASDGGVFSFGDAGFFGSAGGIHLNKPVVGMAGVPGDQGYWLVASDGGIFSYGDAPFHGSTGAMTLNKPIVGMAATPDGGGYWLVASDGGVFSYGDATFLGSTGAMTLNSPIVAMVPTIDGGGYWLVASDGGVFSYGDATFLGSMGGTPLNQPIVGAFTTPDSLGYWLVASDGGVFSFGNAGFFGSTGNLKLVKPIVAGSNPGVPVPTG